MHALCINNRNRYANSLKKANTACFTIIAIEKASLDAIKFENFIPSGISTGYKMGGEGHLFERLHGKNPFIQLYELEKQGLGPIEYKITVID